MGRSNISLKIHILNDPLQVLSLNKRKSSLLLRVPIMEVKAEDWT